MSARGLAAAAIAYLVIAVLWALPITARPAERVPDLGDALHLAWTMAWDAHALVRQPLRLYDANAFHHSTPSKSTKSAPSDTWSPGAQRKPLTTPLRGALIVCSIFIASSTSRGAPFSTVAPA